MLGSRRNVGHGSNGQRHAPGTRQIRPQHRIARTERRDSLLTTYASFRNGVSQRLTLGRGPRNGVATTTTRRIQMFGASAAPGSCACMSSGNLASNHCCACCCCGLLVAVAACTACAKAATADQQRRPLPQFDVVLGSEPFGFAAFDGAGGRRSHACPPSASFDSASAICWSRSAAARW